MAFSLVRFSKFSTPFNRFIISCIISLLIIIHLFPDSFCFPRTSYHFCQQRSRLRMPAMTATNTWTTGPQYSVFKPQHAQQPFRSDNLGTIQSFPPAQFNLVQSPAAHSAVAQTSHVWWKILQFFWAANFLAGWEWRVNDKALDEPYKAHYAHTFGQARSPRTSTSAFGLM